MNNPMQLLMTMMQNGGNINPIQFMSMFNGNPMLAQAQKMLQGKNPNDMKNVIMNVAKQKGIDENQLRQMANNFNIKI